MHLHFFFFEIPRNHFKNRVHFLLTRFRTETVKNQINIFICYTLYKKILISSDTKFGYNVLMNKSFVFTSFELNVFLKHLLKCIIRQVII